MPEQPTEQSGPAPRALRKIREGRVLSARSDKTLVVQSVARVPHPRFRKIVKRLKRFHVHDERNEAREGDEVRIVETRPYSRLKRWRLAAILRRGPATGPDIDTQPGAEDNQGGRRRE